MLILYELIAEERVEIIGSIQQELLAGISSAKQYLILRDKLRAFTDIEIRSEDFERSAEMANTCRSFGIQGSHTDFLICSFSEKYHLSIFPLMVTSNYMPNICPFCCFFLHDCACCLSKSSL